MTRQPVPATPNPTFTRRAELSHRIRIFASMPISKTRTGEHRASSTRWPQLAAFPEHRAAPRAEQLLVTDASKAIGCS